MPKIRVLDVKLLFVLGGSIFFVADQCIPHILILFFLMQPDSVLEEALQGFCNTTPQHLDLKIFSPVFSPMHLEHGSPYLGNHLAACDSGNRHNVMQYGTDAQDLTFLNTILAGPDQSSFEDSGYKQDLVAKENESNSESECKMVQGQVHIYSLMLVASSYNVVPEKLTIFNLVFSSIWLPDILTVEHIWKTIGGRFI